MGLRDLAVLLIVFGSIPVILRRPWIGALVWTWISLMNPHRLTWGFVYSMPMAQIVGGAFILSVLLSKEPKRIPWNPLTVIWALFVVWMCITTIFALNQADAIAGLEKSLKIQVTSFLILMVLGARDRLNLFVWCVTLSIAFFGFKGGIHTFATAGAHKVYGPGGFIEGNNEIAFALVVIFPLLRFLQIQASNRWIRHGLTLTMILCAASVVGSHSRGAFLALIAMGLFLVWKSRKRGLMIVALIMLLPVGVSLVPQHYWERMQTITSYEQDSSAMGRINAWGFALNLVKKRPLTGGGFETFTPQLFRKYAPEPDDHHDVHSIYFEVLGEHGLVGFLLYMTMAILAWRYAGWTVNQTRSDPSLLWHHDLARMTQVCLVGYAVGGAFLGLAYFDLYYDILIMILLNRILVEQRLAAQVPQSGVDSKSNPIGYARPGFGQLAPRSQR